MEVPENHQLSRDKVELRRSALQLQLQKFKLYLQLGIVCSLAGVDETHSRPLGQ